MGDVIVVRFVLWIEFWCFIYFKFIDDVVFIFEWFYVCLLCFIYVIFELEDLYLILISCLLDVVVVVDDVVC